ncbi:MAG: hypothetical protein AAF646_02930 [Pseudomonadota bacterium]
MDDRTAAKALEIAFELVGKHNGTRYVTRPEDVGRTAAAILKAMRNNLHAKEVS